MSVLGHAGKAALASVIIAACSSSAIAGTIDITSISGNWLNLHPNVNQPDSDSIRWGTPVNHGQSGYDFDSTAPLPANVGASTVFDLGTFTHLNRPIRDFTISGASLEVTIGVRPSGSSSNPMYVTSMFDFNHWETPNLHSSANPNPYLTCANGEQNAQGINQYGCADRVTAVTNSILSTSFLFEGKKYLFDVLGFRIGASQFTDFWTKERTDNSAVLQAQYTLAPVPLPAAGWYLLSVIGGFGAVAWRRRRKTA